MRFLHIEDSEEDRILVESLIRRTKHWEYSGVSNLSEGIVLWQQEAPQVILIDIGFNGRPESESYRAIQMMAASACVIVLSGGDGQEAVNKARDAGASSFINKRDTSNAMRFHDAIMEGVEKNISKGIGKNTSDLLLTQLAVAVFYGNGKPSVLARLEAGDTRMQSIETKLDDVKDAQCTMLESQDRKFEEIRKAQKNDRTETRIRGVLLIIGLLITIYGTLTKTPTKDITDAIQNIQNAK